LREAGAGVVVSPNMVRALDRLGLAHELNAFAVRLEAAWEFRRWQDGRVLFVQPMGEQCERLYGVPCYVAHRADLLRWLVQALPGDATGAKPYTVTDWARQAAGVLVAAGKWESEYLSDRTEPLPKIDVEGALLLAIPLVELPDALTGPCLLAISENEKANPAGFAGIAVRIDHGEVLSCTPSSESGNEPQATGAVESWVAAVLEGEFDGITYEGPEAELARVVVESMHLALT